MNYYGVDLPEAQDGEVVLEAVVLWKAISADGRVFYREHKSPSLHYVEALGMAETYADTCRSQLMRNVRPGATPD